MLSKKISNRSIPFLALVVLFSYSSLVAQRPLSQVEGFLEVYNPSDTTSLYIGLNAGEQLFTIGNFNTFVGTDAGKKNYESSNSFFGSFSGSSNTSGSSNSFFGSQAGNSNMSGMENSFFGRESGLLNTTGHNNSFYGAQSGISNNTGYSNSFFGDNSGDSNSSGSSNSFFGEGSGFSNSTGDLNSFFGSRSGFNITTQSKMIIIGSNAGPANPAATDSMQLYIDVEETDDPLIYGDFDNDGLTINGSLGVNTDASNYPLALRAASDSTILQFRTVSDGISWHLKATDDKLEFRETGELGSPLVIYTGDKIGINKEVPTVALDVVGKINATGSINPSSDVNFKEHFVEIQNSQILRKVISLPISSWQYKSSSDRHIGPMAQDFYAAFGLGQGETTIATVDADGVALAAIQALARENEQLNKKNQELEKRINKLESLVLRKEE